MSDPTDRPRVAPPRLREGDDVVARLLRLESQQGRTESPGGSRGWRSARRPRGILSTLATFTVAAAALVAIVVAARREPEHVSIDAEPTSATTATTEAQASMALERSAAPDSSARPPEKQAVNQRPTKSDQSQPEATDSPTPNHLRATAPAERGTGSVARCEPLMQGGKYEQAARCYASIAQGSDMSAELALLERARLESRVLGKKRAALASLDEYDRRFGEGPLFREAALARVEVLSALGRNRETRQQIEAIRGRIPEHAVRLSLLGARLAIEDDDCEDARRHLAHARDLGANDEQLEPLESRCP